MRIGRCYLVISRMGDQVSNANGSAFSTAFKINATIATIILLGSPTWNDRRRGTM